MVQNIQLNIEIGHKILDLFCLGKISKYRNTIIINKYNIGPDFCRFCIRTIQNDREKYDFMSLAISFLFTIIDSTSTRANYSFLV